MLWPFLIARLGRPFKPPELPVSLAGIDVPPPRISSPVLTVMQNAGAVSVSTASDVRIRHAYGKGYLDLLRLRRGEVAAPPDAVAFPESEAAVMALLQIADRHGLAVIPFGGGTSVVGGVEAAATGRPVLCLSLQRLNRLLDVNIEAQTATAETGIRGPDLEAGLGAHGMTLGHFPQSFEFSTLGGWIATRSAGYASTGYGKIESLVVALRAATPVGLITTRDAPGSATGPSLKELLIGSEGTLGIITQATLRVRSVPVRRDYRAWLFRTFDQGMSAVRTIMQGGPIPTVVRLSDGPETEALTAMRTRGRGWSGAVAEQAMARVLRLRGYLRGQRCVAIIGVEDSVRSAQRAWRELGGVLRHHGALPLGSGPARAWYRDRFELPYLRDGLIEAGILVESLETAAAWNRLPALRHRVARALHDALERFDTSPLVLCHLSHAYPTGASLYFTVLANQSPGREAEQWQTAKQAATEAVVRNGGTLSHHHGIGIVHRPWMEDEHGEVGLRALRAVKSALDPNGILNPGKLLP